MKFKVMSVILFLLSFQSAMANKYKIHPKETSYSERESLIIKTTSLAVELMEEYYHADPYIKGLEILFALKKNQNNLEALKKLYKNSQSYASLYNKFNYDQNFYRNISEAHSSVYRTHLRKIIGKIEEFFSESQGSKNYKTLSYLLRGIGNYKTECKVKGGGFNLALLFGMSFHHHKLRCKSTYGRKIYYKYREFNFSVGLGLMGFGNKESVSIPFLFSTTRNKFNTFKVQRALFYAYHKKSENNDHSPIKNSHGGGVGLSSGFGSGIYYKTKYKNPDFSELYRVLAVKL